MYVEPLKRQSHTQVHIPTYICTHIYVIYIHTYTHTHMIEIYKQNTHTSRDTHTQVETHTSRYTHTSRHTHKLKFMRKLKEDEFEERKHATHAHDYEMFCVQNGCYCHVIFLPQ